ncbi:DUF2157 domain-containing protein [Nocardioides sp. GCM10027113]|uniref:DUF2157 domain-containing protein n=1 Tax=unclassified Nocardioides TaxID=2615069 RepID=UPI0036164692
MSITTGRGPTTPPLGEQLEHWMQAGIISPDQAVRIRAYEAGRPAPPAPSPPAPTTGRPPSLVVEALGYLGGAVMLVGSVILVGLLWGDVPVWVRLLLVAVTTLVLLGAGLAVPDRLGAAAARLHAVLWALAVVSTGTFFAVLSVDVLHDGGDGRLLEIFPPTAAVALLLWWWRRTFLQQLVLLVPTLVSAAAAASELAGDESAWVGGITWVVAAAWTALAWAGRLEPRATGVAFGVVGGVFASLAMVNDLGIALGLLTAVALVVAALAARSLPWLGVAAFAVLWTAPRAAVEWFPGRLSAALTLIVTGGLLVGAAVWVARQQGRHQAVEAGSREGSGNR